MDFHTVYRSKADQYQQLVGAEDVDGNLDRVLGEVLKLDGLGVIELGAGTGRVTRLLRRAGAVVTATEPAAAMLAVAQQMAAADTATRLCQAEAKAVPFRSNSFDAAVAGWVFAHQREWSPDSWRTVVAGFIEEAARVVVDGGPIVLIETLGTGHAEPTPPGDLVEYYEWLEADLGFERRWIRTDYSFASVDEAAEVTGGFFGDAFAELVRSNGWARVPECTGIWTRR